MSDEWPSGFRCAAPGRVSQHRRPTLTSTTQAPTSLQVLSNFVNGERSAAADGRTSEVVDPSTGQPYAVAPLSGPADVEAAMRASRYTTFIESVVT